MEVNQLRTLVQTDSGEILWFNPQSGTYQVVDLEEVDDSRNASLSSSAVEVVEEQENQSQLLQKSMNYNNSPKNVKANVWDRTQTLLFVSLCKKNADRLRNPRYKKIEIYKEIAKEMQDHGNNFSAEQCCNKMKSLLCKYKEVKNYNEKSGSNPKKWQFYEEMTDYIGDRPGIAPIASCSSLSTSQTVTRKTSQLCGEEHQKENDGPPRKKRVCQRSSPRAEMLKWLKEYRKDVDSREKARLQLVEKRHQENKQIMAEILDILKKK